MHFTRYSVRLQAHPERVSAYYGAVFAMSLGKPLFGALSDRLPRCRRRRSVMVPACVSAAVCAVLMGAAVRTEAQLYAVGMTTALAYCAAEAAADGALVEAATGTEEVATLQVSAMGIRTAASAAASVAGAASLRLAAPRALISAAGVFGAAAAVASTGLREVTTADAQDAPTAAPALAPASGVLLVPCVRQACAMLQRFAGPMALIIALSVVPSSDDSYAAFITTALRPPLLDWQFGLAMACDTMGALVGTVAYGFASRGRATRSMLAGCTLIAAIGSLLRLVAPMGCLGMPPAMVVPLAAAGVSATARFAFMPQLVLYAQLAPAGAEAMAFSAFATLADGAALAGTGMSAALTAALRVGSAPGRSWQHLPTLVLLCAGMRLLPLVLLPLLFQKRQEPGRLVQTEEGADLTAPLLEDTDS